MPKDSTRLVQLALIYVGLFIEVISVEACFSSLELSTDRANVGLAVSGDKIYFAGGIDQNLHRSDLVDVFDSLTSTWSTLKIPIARDKIEVAAVGSYILFAGGMTPSGPYTKVDILNLETAAIRTLDLPVNFVATNSLILGSRALFYGRNNMTIYVVDPAAHSYSTITTRAGEWSAASNGTHLFTCNIPATGTFASVSVFNEATQNWDLIRSWTFLSRVVSLLMTPSTFVFVLPTAVGMQPIQPIGTGPTFTSTHLQVLAPIVVGEVLFMIEPGRMTTIEMNSGRIQRYATDFQIHTSFKAVEINGVIYYATDDALEPVIRFDTNYLFRSFQVPDVTTNGISNAPPSLAFGDFLFWHISARVTIFNVRTGQPSGSFSSQLPLTTVRDLVIGVNLRQFYTYNVKTEQGELISGPYNFVPTSSATSERSGLVLITNLQDILVYNTNGRTWLPEFKIEPAMRVVLVDETIIGIYSSSIKAINVWTRQDQTYGFTERTDFTLQFSDDLVVIAGGRNTDNPSLTNNVLILNIAQNTYHNTYLSIARRHVAVAIIDHLIVFAGGQLQSGRFSDRLDIFNTQDLHWNLVRDLPAHSILSPVQIAHVQGSLCLIRFNRLDILDLSNNIMRVGMFQFGDVRNVQVFGSKLLLTSMTGAGVHQLAIFETSTDSWYSYEVNRLGIDPTDPLQFAAIVADQLYANTFRDVHQLMPIATMMNRMDQKTLHIFASANLTIETVGQNLSSSWTHNGQPLNESTLSLQINNATYEWAGQYVARVLDHCSMPMQQQIMVAVIGPPVLLEELEDMLQVCKTQSTFSIRVAGFGVSTIWTVNGQAVDHSTISQGAATISTIQVDDSLPCGQHTICINATNAVGSTSMCSTLTSWLAEDVMYGPNLQNSNDSVLFSGDTVELYVMMRGYECSNHTWFIDDRPHDTSDYWMSVLSVTIDQNILSRKFTVRAQCGTATFTSRAFEFSGRSTIPITLALFVSLVVLGAAFVAALIVTAVFVAKRMRQGQQHEVELQQLLSKAKNESLTQQAGIISNWLPTDDYTYHQLQDLPCRIDTSEMTAQSKNDPIKVDTWTEFGLTCSPKGKKNRDSMTPSMKESLIKGTPISFYVPSSSKYTVNIEPSSIDLADNETIRVKISVMMLMTTKCNISVVIVCDKKKVYSIFEFKVASQMSMWIDLDEIQMNGNYLGGGGFGAVYQGIYRGQEVAVKQLLNQHLDEYLKKEFEREILLMKDLRHPNIVQFVGASKVKDNLAIVIEFAPLGSLSSVLEAQKLPSSLKLTILSEIAKALQFLHANGVIHRDIKPQNVLVFSLEQRAPVHIKLTDFGTSRFISDDPQTITRNVGTTCYMAPEALGIAPKIDKSADVYSFAILSWEVMFEQQPFENFKWQSDVEAHVKVGKRLPFPEHANEVFVKIIEDCWHQDPAQRPTMTAVTQRLAALIPQNQ